MKYCDITQLNEKFEPVLGTEFKSVALELTSPHG